mgnify:FL=1
MAASSICKRNHYLYSSIVEAQYHGHSFLLKLVFVSNRGSKNKYLVLATTQTKLRPEEIVQLYGRRWQIETYFKTSKQYLALDKSQVQSYDGQCGYIAVTAITYDLLAWQERQNTDDKIIGDLFYLMNESLPDIKFIDALVYLILELKELKQTSFEKIDGSGIPMRILLSIRKRLKQSKKFKKIKKLCKQLKICQRKKKKKINLI